MNSEHTGQSRTMALMHPSGRRRRRGRLGWLLAAGWVAAAVPAWAIGPERLLPVPQEIEMADESLAESDAPVELIAVPEFGSQAISTNAIELESGLEGGAATNATGTNDVTIVTPAKSKMYAALLEVHDKEYAKAIPKLEEAINEDPSLLPAWQALGWSYLAVGRKDDLRKLWERLLALAPNEPLAYNNLAMLAAGSGETERASVLYRKSLELNPDQNAIRFNYCRTLLWQGKYNEAIPSLSGLLDQDPDRIDIRLELARALTFQQKYDEALVHLNVVCEQFPDSVPYAVTRAQNLLYAGDLQLATEEAQHILEMDPDNTKALSLMADIAEFSNKPEDAAKELRKLADRTQDKLMKTQILYRLALLLQDLHASNPWRYPLRDIIAVASEGVKSDPRNVDMRLILCELLGEDRQYGAAGNEFETVLKDFNGNNLRAKYGLTDIYCARGQSDEAMKLLRDTLAKFDPYDPYRYYYLARLEYDRGNYFEALQMLERLEKEGARGAVFILLYHGLSDSECTSMTSVRQLREHLQALQRAGFKFIAPDQIPAYFEDRPPPPESKAEPILNRWWHWIRYSFTGKNKPKPPALRDYHPDKVVCVTFDDGLRSSLFFGTPIAEELDTRFGLYIPLNGVQRHSPYAASWEELRRYQTTGCWTYGSHLADAHLRIPIDAEGYLAASLPNQMWDKARNRQETLRAYQARMHGEFRTSRETIIKEIGLNSNDCRIVAYPYGDIGQMGVCNVRNVGNVCETILNGAHRNYDMGLLQSRFGYAVKGDNPMLYQRYPPMPREGGKQVVKQAFENHPVFLARRMRAEIAALQGKPNLAVQMMDELNRDGYPEPSLKELRKYVRERLAGDIQQPQAETAESKREQRWLALAHPYVGGNFNATRDNVVIDEWHLVGQGGVNINPRLTVEALGGIGRIDQTITTVTPSTTRTLQGTTNRFTTITTVNGTTSYKETTTITYVPVTNQTSTTFTEDFKADERMGGLRLNYRIPGGTVLFGELRQRSFTAKPQTNWQETITNINGVVVTNIGPATFTDDSEIVGALELQLKPLLALDVSARFEHDVIPSAHSIITYNSGALRGLWRMFDWWNLEADGEYTLLSDNNTMLRMMANTEWLLSEKQGMHIGMQYQFITAEDASIEYWTPYWQQRFYLTARMQRSFFANYTSVRARVGWSKESMRPQQEQINPDPEQPGWNAVVGVDGSLRRNLFGHLDAYAQFSVNFIQDFTERNVVVGLIYDFEGQR
ncbi:MAG: tetratricopeptide repeat protein [Kiritimatiellae bacterium]|nr:tetratricopeptide repeat protein [Kiritimatiellia bacterium]